VTNTWNPKGGEFEIKPLLVDIEDITGPPLQEGDEKYVRPDSGNLEAKKALAEISLDFILGKPLEASKLAELDKHLPMEPIIPMFEEVAPDSPSQGQ
jgi:hypothetical protein